MLIGAAFFIVLAMMVAVAWTTGPIPQPTILYKTPSQPTTHETKSIVIHIQGRRAPSNVSCAKKEVKLKTYNVVIPLVEPGAGGRVAVPRTAFGFLECDGSITRESSVARNIHTDRYLLWYLYRSASSSMCSFRCPLFPSYS